MKRAVLLITPSGVLALATFVILAADRAPQKAPAQIEGIAEMVSEADFILEGQVVNLDYRLSDKRSEEDERLPHTFVTYEVGNLLKGESEVRTITLRFIGGPDGRGRYYTVSHVPIFEEGDSDILFVVANGEHECPLVNCRRGRFRVFKERLYTAEGFPIYVSEKGDLIIRGAAEPSLVDRKLPMLMPELHHEAPEVQRKLLEQIPEELREQLAADWERQSRTEPVLETEFEGPLVEDNDVHQRQREQEPLRREALVDFIRKEVERQLREGAEQGKITSVSIDNPFYVDPPKPAAPPEALQEDLPRVPEPSTEQERRELEMLEEQEGDPVIRRE